MYSLTIGPGELQRCALPSEWEGHDAVRAMQALVATGALSKWDVGLKHGRISSELYVAGDSLSADKLTAVDSSDRNYGNLVAAHLARHRRHFCSVI